MKTKYSIILLLIIFIGLNANAQSDSNTIIIQGVTYYFRPSTTPSSPQPERSGDFFKSGKWYGKEAATAWASVADWVIERCLIATGAIYQTKDDILYISAVYIYKTGDSDYNKLTQFPGVRSRYDKEIRIDYWIVEKGDQMSNGSRRSRWFSF
jgi:hypothetical protein